jgi:aldehyde:ferredoxin oxidoreductase
VLGIAGLISPVKVSVMMVVVGNVGVTVLSPQAASAVIENNTVYSNGTAGGSAINLDGVQSSVVRNNLLYDNHASGVSLYKIDGAQVDKYITKKLSCGDCPMPCKGIVKVKSRNLTDVRRPDYETIVGFGANILNDDNFEGGIQQHNFGDIITRTVVAEARLRF